MLLIRNKQLQVLSRAVLENGALRHVKEHLPGYCKVLPEPSLAALVARAVDTAQRYRFSAGRDILQFVSLVIVLGEGFDRDPRLPWAREILTATDPVLSRYRGMRLWDRAVRHLEEAEAERVGDLT